MLQYLHNLKNCVCKNSLTSWKMACRFCFQGGPGLSGTGLGNFVMFGPLDENLEPRNVTWVRF